MSFNDNVQIFMVDMEDEERADDDADSRALGSSLGDDSMIHRLKPLDVVIAPMLNLIFSTAYPFARKIRNDVFR